MKCELCDGERYTEGLCDQCGQPAAVIPGTPAPALPPAAALPAAALPPTGSFGIKCESCGNVQQSGRTCEACGRKIIIPVPRTPDVETHRCRQCGTLASQIICRNCGVNVPGFPDKLSE